MVAMFESEINNSKMCRRRLRSSSYSLPVVSRLPAAVVLTIPWPATLYNYVQALDLDRELDTKCDDNRCFRFAQSPDMAEICHHHLQST